MRIKTHACFYGAIWKTEKKNNHLPPPTCFTMSNKKNATIKMEKWIIGWMRVYLTHHSTNYVEYKIKMNNLQCSKYMCEGFIRKLVNESKSLASLRKKHAMNPPPEPSQWDSSDEGPQHTLCLTNLHIFPYRQICSNPPSEPSQQTAPMKGHSTCPFRVMWRTTSPITTFTPFHLEHCNKQHQTITKRELNTNLNRLEVYLTQITQNIKQSLIDCNKVVWN